MEAPRALRSLGLEKFLEEYEFWETKPSLANAIAYQVDKNISNEAGAYRRAGAAKKIFSDPDLLSRCLAYAAFHAIKIRPALQQKAQEKLSILSKQFR